MQGMSNAATALEVLAPPESSTCELINLSVLAQPTRSPADGRWNRRLMAECAGQSSM